MADPDRPAAHGWWKPALVAGLLIAASLLAGCASNQGETSDGAAAASCPDDLSSVPSHNATVVEMDGNVYKPQKTTVEPGETVVWVNREETEHTVTPDEDEDAWPGDPEGSGSSRDAWMEKGDEWRWCFEEPGTYSYHCIPHATRSESGYKGMIGTVTVER